MPRQERRQALVEVAFRQIAERGFEGLRTRDVANEAGVNIATLHYYFPTKEALIRGVVEHAMQRFRSTLEPHGSSADQVVNHMRAVRRLLGKEPELGAVMAELSLRAARDPAIAALLEETNLAWHRMVSGLLRRALRDGHLREDLDVEAGAALIVATLSSMTLPVLNRTDRMDDALGELRRWLGAPLPAEPNQSLD